MLIVWIYFIFVLNLIFSIISSAFRIFRYMDALNWEPIIIINSISQDLLLPIKDFFLSMTLLALVYQ